MLKIQILAYGSIWYFQGSCRRYTQDPSKTYGFEYNIAVPHNIIGPKQKYDDAFRNVASIMINLILQKS